MTMSPPREEYKPAYLGTRATEPIEEVDLIPWEGRQIEITLVCEEFTSLCPVTGQPDFGRLEIGYVPNQALIESKSLKLYLLKFRQEGIFSEVLVDRIANELWKQADPKWIRVRGNFNSRGGIAIQAEAVRGDTPS